MNTAPVERINGTAAYPYPTYVLTKVQHTPHPSSSSECWRWPLYIAHNGYGSTTWYDGFRNHNVLVHRVSWVVANERPIPDGMTIHHICYNRACWNPSHLAVLSMQENCRDNKWARKTHCKWGHEFTEANTRITPRGRRDCRACARDTARRARSRAREAAR